MMPQADYFYVRDKLLRREEIALLDIREEAPHAESHPLFAAQFSLTRLEADAFSKMPNRKTAIVTLDDGEGLAETAARRLSEMGYTNVRIFAGGIQAWSAAGGELFRDVNVPSKSFGEFVEAHRHTPSLSAEEVQTLLKTDEDVVVVDVRRFDEYQTMSIPRGISVPGAELVLRVPELAPNPSTRVIVNCAGRTRSIIGTQSLINAGLPNPICALRNGTIGWTLAGQALDRGASRQSPQPSAETLRIANERSRHVADRAGEKRCSLSEALAWRSDPNRTTYFFDPRTAQEYEQGHYPGFQWAPGGQLVQETEMMAPVRGARIVLADPLGPRANMTASWLAPMDWEVAVIDGGSQQDLTERGPWQAPRPPLPAVNEISPADCDHYRADSPASVIVDFSTHAQYVRAHVPGACWVLRSQLDRAISELSMASSLIVMAADDGIAAFCAQELQGLLPAHVELRLLQGGLAAWRAAGKPIEEGATRLLAPPIDRYRRPYEGTAVTPAAMQAYLDWEFGLVEQLRRDGSHHFRVI